MDQKNKNRTKFYAAMMLAATISNVSAMMHNPEPLMMYNPENPELLVMYHPHPLMMYAMHNPEPLAIHQYPGAIAYLIWYKFVNGPYNFVKRQWNLEAYPSRRAITRAVLGVLGVQNQINDAQFSHTYRRGVVSYSDYARHKIEKTLGLLAKIKNHLEQIQPAAGDAQDVLDVLDDTSWNSSRSTTLDHIMRFQRNVCIDLLEQQCAIQEILLRGERVQVPESLEARRGLVKELREEKLNEIKEWRQQHLVEVVDRTRTIVQALHFIVNDIPEDQLDKSRLESYHLALIAKRGVAEKVIDLLFYHRDLYEEVHENNIELDEEVHENNIELDEEVHENNTVRRQFIAIDILSKQLKVIIELNKQLIEGRPGHINTVISMVQASERWIPPSFVIKLWRHGLELGLCVMINVCARTGSTFAKLQTTNKLLGKLGLSWHK